MKQITYVDIADLAHEYGLDEACLKAVISVESGGKGFDETTGKILIQFEPIWFKRKSPFTPSGTWSVNGVERQAKEWEAFNDAYAKDPNAALLSTSIGMMQVMGFNHLTCGFKDVNSFWDFAKVSEANQVRLGLNFIRSNRKMFASLKALDFASFAYYYNGAGYKKFNYDKRLKEAYLKFKI